MTDKMISIETIKERIDFLKRLPSWASEEFDEGANQAFKLVDEIIEDLETGNERWIYFRDKKGTKT